MPATDDWAPIEGPVGRHIDELNQRCLAAYAANPALVEEHANAERIQTEGGYGRRQVWELIQNGADEMLKSRGRIEVVLTNTHLYCADEGAGVSPDGAEAILSAYRSAKKGAEIGRFGLGFKSVLGVSSTPDFFSRPGSFGFDPSFAAAHVREAIGAMPEVPTLRLARSLDPAAARSADAVLDELMAWATTVVRLPLTRGRGQWLHDDLAGFQSQFLVFAPQISELVLDDRVRKHRREISLVAGKGKFEHVLVEGNQEDLWRVFTSDFKPSPAAAQDGGAMANRKKIQLQWAVPIKARARIGELWAYFPTLEDTTLSGVINAPWKLNDDRTRVIEGPFNQEILDHAADLVLRNLEVLVDPEDPGNVLDILPARGREERNWADGFLTERLNRDVATHESIPNQAGRLTAPTHLNLHPEDVDLKALRVWSKIPGRPEDWAHPSVATTPTRRARVRTFFEAAAEGRRATVAQWLEALIPEPGKDEPISLNASGYALLVAAVAAKEEVVRERARAAEIAVDDDGVLAPVSALMLPGTVPVTAPGIRLVHHKLAASQKVRPALDDLGVAQVDAELELRTVLAGRRAGDISQDWQTLWDLARRTAPELAVQAFADAGFSADNLRVRVESGDFLPISATLLPGDIVRSGVAPDVVIDTEHHRGELDLLRRIGAVSAPSAGGAGEREPAMRVFREAAIDEFIAKNPKSNPTRDKVELGTGPVAGPLTPLESLEGAAKARYTSALLDAQNAFGSCEVRYPGNRYRAINVDHPVIDMVRRHGLADTASGLLPADLWVGPTMRAWKEVLPVADVSPAAAAALKLPQGLEDLTPEQWAEAYRRVIENGSLDLAVRFYSVAARSSGPRPAQVLANVATEHVATDIEQVRITSSQRAASVLGGGGCPILLASDEDVAVLVERWGLRLGDDDIASEVVFEESAPRVPLVDHFPGLRLKLSDSQRELELVWCSEIRIETSGAGGLESETKLVHLDDGCVYVDDRLQATGILKQLSTLLGLGLDAAAIDRIIENKLNQEIKKKISEVRKQKTDEDRLALILGVPEMRAELPAALLEAVEKLHGPPDAPTLARLVFAVYGTETLKRFAGALEEAGLQPPRTWSGSQAAVEFVRKLGFGQQNAGFPGAKRDKELEVDGPPALNPLHEYQETVVQEIHRVLDPAQEPKHRRGMMSLPTGAGKTRVAIQALVEALREGELKSPVLWVAQRDELCEQAVQAWSEVWRDQGPQDRLTISRLWSTNEADPVPTGTQVVVCTIAKLASGVMESAAYKWLAEATCIVIDEAHLAHGPSYTSLLAWQGMDRNKARVPLIGLTATPYRGMSEDETKALANRFGNHRIDHAAFGEKEPYAQLQEMGVLSRVEHRMLEGGTVTLSSSELEELKRMKTLPKAAGGRLGADLKRNQGLLESLLSHDDDWTSLVFCTSLDHAKVMAGLLTAEGVPAAFVSGATPPAARRHYITEFKAGRIRVLTNYGVFVEGFDAPMVRAVYVARPTYSPNAYQQMIGRGLRGPKNGGSEECLIVNVADNVANYGEALAFRQFEHLWVEEKRA